MRSTYGFARRAALAASATWLVLLVGAGGCASPAPQVAPAPIAHMAKVELVNLCAFDWQVTLVAPTSHEECVVHLSARETARVELGGGDYTVTQVALSTLAGQDSTRQFATHLEAGEAYRWQLATLLSASTSAAP